jgi:hypothetical protein
MTKCRSEPFGAFLSPQRGFLDPNYILVILRRSDASPQGPWMQVGRHRLSNGPTLRERGGKPQWSEIVLIYLSGIGVGGRDEDIAKYLRC